MPALRRPGNTRSTSWNYSNAESFNDDMYSNMTFYDPSSPPHYATLPRNFNKRQRKAEASSPYHDTRRLLGDHTSDSGYDSNDSTSPEPESWHPPTRQNTLLRHSTNDRSCRSDYYFIERLSADAVTPLSIEHGIGSGPNNPSISFICSMQPLSLFPSTNPSNNKKRRRITNNDFSKSDADPLTYIRDNCENATRALSSHRKLHNCDCDFAWLDNRKRGTGTVKRGAKVDEKLGPMKPCKKTWFTGWFVRQHLAYHDRYCGCSCFGVKH